MGCLAIKKHLFLSFLNKIQKGCMILKFNTKLILYKGEYAYKQIKVASQSRRDIHFFSLIKKMKPRWRFRKAVYTTAHVPT